ncbi:MAG: LapA family protein [Gammaproteobacteria bacterium]|nr:LapA family protein [Gammaproteobacteria bacterium]
MKRIIFLIIFLVVFLLGASFALSNAQDVQLSYYFFETTVKLPWVIFGSMCVGVVLGIFSMMSMVIRLKHELSRKNKEVKVIEKEVANLRALPLKDKH